MALPTVRMHSPNSPFPISSLVLSTGAVAVTGGYANVPILQVKEAMAKNWAIVDPAFRWPPRKSDMCPPAPLSPVIYLPAPTQPIVDNGAGDWNSYPNNTTRMNPASAGMTGGPALGGPDIVKFFPAFRPQADSTPYAALALPDGTSINVPYPGMGVVTVPDQHVAFFKTQGWVLLSDVMPS